MKKFLEVLQAFLSLSSGVFPVLERKVTILPINPAIRQDVLVIAVIIASISGLGAYVTVKYNKHTATIGWCGLIVLLLSVLFVLLVASAGMTFGLSPVVQAAAMRGSYVIVFGCIGLSVGGFLGLIR